jgi:biopolymer transport protein ExbD
MEPMRFGEAPRRRGPSLTPMIDVVFLLLVFFMLAARFGMEEAVPLGVAGSGGAYEGPPRLIEVRPDGLLLNGVVVAETALAEALAALTQGPDDLVVLRGRDGADTQSIVRALDLLAAAGHRRVALVE